jgi:hypothetical protein
LESATLKSQFSYFYKKVFKKRYDFSDRDEQYIQNFLSILQSGYQDGVGEEWLFEYLLFQFNKYSSAETKMNIQLHWIYGKKALGMWKDRNLEHHQYFDEQFQEQYNIKRRDVIVEEPQNVSKEYKKKERNRFVDLSRRLIHCYELSLFDESCIDCMMCKNKNKCKK